MDVRLHFRIYEKSEAADIGPGNSIYWRVGTADQYFYPLCDLFMDVYLAYPLPIYKRPAE
jgi:hypothetical protein